MSDKAKAYSPAATADVIGSAGDPFTITAGAKVWKVGFPTQRAKDRYEKYVYEREKQIVLAQKADNLLDADEYRARVDRLTEDVNDRAFATGGALWLKHSAKPAMWVKWFKSLLAEHHADVTDADVQAVMAGEPEQVKWALAAVIPPFVAWVSGMTVRALTAAAGDPKKLAELRKGLAGMMAEYPEMFPDPPTPSA